MNVEFEKEYLAELYEKGKTDDKKHRFQPQIVNGYLKCVKALLNASRMEDLYQYRSLNYEKLKGDKKGLSFLRINGQYKLEFREIANAGNQAVIEICSLVDITNHYKQEELWVQQQIIYITTEFALLLEAALSINADLLVRMQTDYNIQVARKNDSLGEKLNNIKKLAAVF